uniref:equilibrative nucleoside transporter 1-like n=1 Tax=Myxine glutinosa TaxID=7769 RepID=UPI00358F1CC0
MALNKPPQDKYHRVWIIFFILGLGSLLPWNFFMTAGVYFRERLDRQSRGEENEWKNNQDAQSRGEEDEQKNKTDTAVPSHSYYFRTFDNFMTLCAMLPLLIFCCLNSILHRRVPQKIRMAGSLFGIFLLFLLTTILIKVEITNPDVFFVITMITIILNNSMSAVFQSSMFGLVGLLPTRYTMPPMSGQGMAGTFAAIAMIFSLSVGSNTAESAFWYFLTACVVTLFATTAYMALGYLEFAQYYLHSCSANTDNSIDAIEKDIKKASVPLTDGVPKESKHVSLWVVFRKLWVMALSVTTVFWVTISVFPVVTGRVQTISTNEYWVKFFSPVCCFLLFNVADLFGRSFTAFVMWPREKSRLLPLFVLLRIVFIPLFLLCNIQKSLLPTIFHHDAFFILFMIVFGTSNGYLASLAMAYGPRTIKGREAETAGSIMMFFLALGLSLGACSSFIFAL